MGADGTEGTVAASQLRGFVDRIEQLEAQKQEIADLIKDVFGEAKATGFDAKALRKVIALRKKDEDERAYERETLDLYLAALGMMG
ncbi:DUF2312 domain-containing protein [Rhizobium sp. CSW-27]|uniref:DUF2312 domain-containing protein n=1 Tax=Rhizobium sp. CSW-27 TaxID=2839985 RepID=UPI00338D7C15